MMRSFELSRHRRARVWLDEAPPAGFVGTIIASRVLLPKRSVEAARTMAGIEVNIPHGPRASYALLGCELVETNEEGLEVLVSANNAGVAFQGSLALQPDEVKVGLPQEYTEAVIAGVSRVAESDGAPTRAAVQFRWAANGRVGSSGSVFAKVSELLIRLLMLPRSASDQEIVALFE